MPIPVYDIESKVVGDSLQPSFFDDEVMFVINDSILRTGDICIVQLNCQYYVMKVSQNRDNGDILLNSLNSSEVPNKGKSGSELDNYVQQKAIYNSLSWKKDFIRKLFLWFYCDYIYCSMNNKKTNLWLISD